LKISHGFHVGKLGKQKDWITKKYLPFYLAVNDVVTASVNKDKYTTGIFPFSLEWN